MSAMWEGKRVENQTLMKHDDAVVGELRRSAQEEVLDGDTFLHDPSLVPFEAWQQPRGFHVEVQFVRVPVFFCHACARGSRKAQGVSLTTHRVAGRVAEPTSENKRTFAFAGDEGVPLDELLHELIVGVFGNDLP
jgi:hypothetical protein